MRAALVGVSACDNDGCRRRVLLEVRYGSHGPAGARWLRDGREEIRKKRKEVRRRLLRSVRLFAPVPRAQESVKKVFP